MTRGEIKALDKEFSLLIRSRGKCEKCGSDRFLQTSHVFSRRHIVMRWSFLNAKCLCRGCHWWWGKNPAEAMIWFIKKYGQKRVDALVILKRQTGKHLTPELVRASWKVA